MSITKMLKQNERRLIFLILLILSILPAFIPTKFPLALGDSTKKLYYYIDQLQPGSKILMSFNFAPAGWVEVGDGMEAIVQHLINKNMKIVFVSFAVTGPPLVERVFNEINVGGAKYGVDYVNLGFIPGIETGMAAFVENPRRYSIDYYGTSINGLPLMKEINSISDFSAYIFSEMAAPDAEMRQFSGKVPVMACVISPSAASLITPWAASGQLHSYLMGANGAAQYETLLGIPRGGMALMGATNLTLSFGIALMIFGNVIYFYERYKQPKKVT